MAGVTVSMGRPQRTERRRSRTGPAVGCRLFPPFAARRGIARPGDNRHTNATKHAEATHVRFSLTQEGGKVCLTIGDDGVGGADPDR